MMFAVAYLWHLLSDYNKLDSDCEDLERQQQCIHERSRKGCQKTVLENYKQELKETEPFELLKTEADKHSLVNDSCVSSAATSPRNDAFNSTQLEIEEWFADRTQNHEEEMVIEGPKFHPPVYVQRYNLVQKILQKHAIKSVVDFGCAECKIVHWMKSVNSLRHLYLVDVDHEKLRSSRAIIKPLNYDYLQRRPNPLTISMLHGSAGVLDHRLSSVQAASLVEVVEHLEPEVLQQVTQCVFGRLRPSLVIITTPNADFNILFPNLTTFRHWDHKFEWTRDEFCKWCSDVCLQYGYSVSYTGVGDPPQEMKQVGFCTQAAIFTETSGKPGEQTDDEMYELVQESVYPYDKRTPAEKLASEVNFQINSCSNSDTYISADDPTKAIIPIIDIANDVVTHRKRNQWTQADVVEYLQSSYTLTKDRQNIVVQLCDQSSSDSYSDYDLDDNLEECTKAQLQAAHIEEDWG